VAANEFRVAANWARPRGGAPYGKRSRPSRNIRPFAVALNSREKPSSPRGFRATADYERKEGNGWGTQTNADESAMADTPADTALEVLPSVRYRQSYRPLEVRYPLKKSYHPPFAVALNSREETVVSPPSAAADRPTADYERKEANGLGTQMNADERGSEGSARTSESPRGFRATADYGRDLRNSVCGSPESAGDPPRLLGTAEWNADECAWSNAVSADCADLRE